MKTKNPIVKAFDWIIDTITELFVSLFDGLLRGVDHATPSTFALDATLLPWLLPLPIAWMTATSLETYFAWEPWAAYVMGFGLEGLGILVWARLANAFVESRVMTGAKWMLIGVAVVYETILIVLNVILAITHGADVYYALVLFLVCLLPALSAILYGFHKYEVIAKLDRETAERKAMEEREKREAAELKERIRLERAAERKAEREARQYSADGGETMKLKRFRKRK